MYKLYCHINCLGDVLIEVTVSLKNLFSLCEIFGSKRVEIQRSTYDSNVSMVIPVVHKWSVSVVEEGKIRFRFSAEQTKGRWMESLETVGEVLENLRDRRAVSNTKM